jgi:hypothetical protein
MSGVSRDYYAGRQRGLAEGEERATDRIIKLLREQTCMYGEHCADGECSFHEILNYAIALIEEGN